MLSSSPLPPSLRPCDSLTIQHSRDFFNFATPPTYPLHRFVAIHLPWPGGTTCQLPFAISRGRFYQKFGFEIKETKENYYKKIEPAAAHLLQYDLVDAAAS